MNNKIKISSIAIFSALFSYAASAADEGIRIDLNNSTPSSAPQVGTKSPGLLTSDEVSDSDKDFFKRILEKSKSEGYLSPDEMEKIKRKEHILFKYLYEQEQLQNLRGVLEEQKTEEQKKSAIKEKFPLTPEELRMLKQLDSKVAEAQNAPVSPVEFQMKTITIDIDAPKPIVIRVAKGYVSSIMFFDQTGAPWPIEGNIIGDNESFKSYPVEGKEHIGVFEINARFKESNALVNLKDLNVPIVIRLSGSESDIDSRIGIQIPKFGPGSRDLGYSMKSTERSNPVMLNVLNGDRISDAKLYDLNGVKGTAWYKDGYLYIRTMAELISPPWKEQVSSPSGYNVYQVPPVSNLLFTVDGEMQRATIESNFQVKLKQKQSIFE